MTARYLPIVLAGLLTTLWLSACQPVSAPAGHAAGAAQAAATVVATATAQPPELPNLLMLTTATVEVRRLDSTAFVPVPLGAEVEPGDTLRLVAGEAAIFCGAEADWGRNPLALSATGNSGVPCGVGRPPRPYPDAAIVRSRGGDEHTTASEIYILSPRSGSVMNDRPTLVWHEIAGTASYTVTLESDDGIIRTIVADGSSLAYPMSWEPLQTEGANYRLIVATDDKTSGNKTPSFSLLENQDEFRDKVERLQQRAPTKPVGILLLAEIYLSRDLRSEAVEILTALPDADEIIAVQSLLGETYLNMGLVAQGQAAYSRMAELAEAQGFVEAQAQALTGRGFAACALRDLDAVNEQWTQAYALYTQHSLNAQAAKIQALVADTQELCR